MFRNVNVTSPTNDNVCLTTLVKSLRAGPWNGMLVESLSISGTGTQRSDHISTALLLLSSLLKNVTLLRLGSVDMVHLHPDFFRYLAQFKSIRRLQFSVPARPTIQHYARLVQALPKLSSLFLTPSYIDLKHRPARSKAIARRPMHPTLSALEIELGTQGNDATEIHSPFFQWIVMSTTITHTLTNFEYNCIHHATEAEITMLNDFLAHCGALKRIAIHALGRCMGDVDVGALPIQHINLEHNVNLNFLSFGFLTLSTSPWYHTLVSTITSTHLSSIRIIFEEDYMTRVDWQSPELDKTIHSLIVSYPRLRIESEVHYEHSEFVLWNDLPRRWKNLLPSVWRLDAFSSTFKPFSGLERHYRGFD
ncbi:unnamed protein product [Somion occarium]